MSQEALYRLLERIEPPGEPIFGWDEVSLWPEGEFDSLIKAGLLLELSPSKSVICDACEQVCIENVVYGQKEISEQPSGFIVCTQREDIGRVPVDLNRLRQWCVNIKAIAGYISEEISHGSKPKELIVDRLWHVGKVNSGRKRFDIYIFRGATCDDALQIIRNVKSQLSKSTLFFLFPDKIPDEFPLSIGNNRLSLKEILLINNGVISVDLNEILGIITSCHSRRIRRVKTVEPIKVPNGTKWEHIAIMFNNEETVQISCGPNVITHRSFIEMGFKDDRRTEMEVPDLIWDKFKELARRNGIKGQRDPEDQHDPESTKILRPSQMKTVNESRALEYGKWKDYISAMNERLEALFPDIKGNPIKYYKIEREYRTLFTLVSLTNSPEI